MGCDLAGVDVPGMRADNPRELPRNLSARKKIFQQLSKMGGIFGVEHARNCARTHLHRNNPLIELVYLTIGFFKNGIGGSAFKISVSKSSKVRAVESRADAASRGSGGSRSSRALSSLVVGRDDEVDKLGHVIGVAERDDRDPALDWPR